MLRSTPCGPSSAGAVRVAALNNVLCRFLVAGHTSGLESRAASQICERCTGIFGLPQSRQEACAGVLELSVNTLS